MEKRPPSPGSPLRLLYIVATLPFILAAILYFTGAFRSKTPDKPSTPSASPAPIPSPAAQSSSPSEILSTRLDTAPHHPPGKNAADFYKNAYGLFKGLNLTDEEKKLLGDRSGKWDPAEAKALFEKLQPIMDLLRQAKGATYTDWGLGKGPPKWNAPMPQMNIVQQLGRVVAWNSAYEFASDPALALRDLSLNTGLTASASGTLIGALVGRSITSINVALISRNGATLTPELAREAILLDQANGQANFRDDLRGEVQFQLSVINSFRNPATQAEALRAIMSVSDGHSEAQKAEAEQKVPQIMADLEWSAGTFRDFAEKVDAPEAEFRDWLADVASQGANHPFATTNLSLMIQTLRNGYLQTRIQSTMLQAGLSILQSGDAALAKYPDPTTGQPFTLVPTADGFALQSTFQYQGKPGVMPFPTAKP